MNKGKNFEFQSALFKGQKNDQKYEPAILEIEIENKNCLNFFILHDNPSQIILNDGLACVLKEIQTETYQGKSIKVIKLVN